MSEPLRDALLHVSNATDCADETAAYIQLEDAARNLRDAALPILASYDLWSKQRSDLSAREMGVGAVDPGEWEASDEEGVHLARELATILREGGVA